MTAPRRWSLRYAQIAFAAVQPIRIEISDLLDVLRRIDERGGVARGWFFEPMPAYILARYDDVKVAFRDTETFSPAATQEAMWFPLIGATFLGCEDRKHCVHRRAVQRPSANNRARNMWIPC